MARDNLLKSERREMQRQFDMTGVRPDRSQYTNRRASSGQG